MRMHNPEQINLRVTTELRNKLEARCAELGLDRSTGCRLALQAWIDSTNPVATSTPVQYAGGNDEARLSALEAKLHKLESALRHHHPTYATKNDIAAIEYALESQGKYANDLCELIGKVREESRQLAGAPSAMAMLQGVQ